MKYYFGFLAWVFALVVALCVDNHAFASPVVALNAVTAATLAARNTRNAPSVEQWEQFNDSCQGEPTLRANGKDNPACHKRDSIAEALLNKGWLQCNHGVWLSPEQITWFAQVLNKIDLQARDMPYAIDSLMPILLAELRKKLHDDQIFAIWNEQRPAIQAYVPFGATVMTSMMQNLARRYARSNDPRFYLEP